MVVVALALPLMFGSMTSCGERSSSFAYIDQTGQVRIRLESNQSARSFAEGLAAVSVDGKWGYIDTAGVFVIPPRFGWAEEFSEGLALVTSSPAEQYWKSDTLFGFINKTGEYAIAPRFHWAKSFSEGLAPVCTGLCRGNDLAQARIGYIDRTGKYVLPAKYRRGGRFSEGLASASATAGIFAPMGFIDKLGRFVIAPRYMWAGEFSHGLAETDQGFVNRSGDIAIPKHGTEQGVGFRSGWAPILEGGSVTYIDTTGKVVLKTRYQDAGPFSEDLAAACERHCGPSGSDGSWGYIDRKGQFAIKPQFGYRPGPFRNGLALVCFGCTE